MIGKLRDLLKRLEAATGPSRELDALVECALNPPPKALNTELANPHVWAEGYVTATLSDNLQTTYPVAAFTESIDRVEWLRREVLPLYSYSIDASAPDAGIDAVLYRDEAEFSGTGATEALARLISMVRARLSEMGA